MTEVYVSGVVRVEALRGIGLTLHEGELAVLLGPSGSGKSRLLNILGGLADGVAIRPRDRGCRRAAEPPRRR